MACRPHGDGHPGAIDVRARRGLTGYLQPVAHTPLQHAGGGDAGQKQTLPPWFVAAKSFSYWGLELSLMDAFGQKQFDVHASPSHTPTQSLSAVHDVA